MKSKAETGDVGAQDLGNMETKLDLEIQEKAKGYTTLNLEQKIELLGLITKDIKTERDTLQSRLNKLDKLFSTEVVSTPRRQTATASTGGKRKGGKRAETAAADAEKIHKYIKENGPVSKGKVQEHFDMYPATLDSRLKLLKGKIEANKEGTSLMLSAK